MLGVRLRDIGLLLANDVKGHQGVAKDVAVNGGSDRLDGAQPWQLICAGCERKCGHDGGHKAWAARLIDRIIAFPNEPLGRGTSREARAVLFEQTATTT